jgi:hypothetical protein
MILQFDSLAVEVTRRCNMQCAHCLRGEAENVDINCAYIRKLLAKTDKIGTVTFTGGEPSLAVDKIRLFREICAEYGVDVYGFYVVTNGKEVTSEFLREMMEWYVYVADCGGDSDSCGLALSKDNFHEKIPDKNERLLRAMSFFREDKFSNFKDIPLLDLGRSRGLVSYQKRDPKYYGVAIERDGNNILFEDTVTLTAEGNLLSDCDYEYDTMEDLAFGHVDDLEALLKLNQKEESV